MESSTSIIPYLFAVTFALAIAFGIWQYVRASKARREHHRSADAAVNGDKPVTPARSTPR